MATPIFDCQYPPELRTPEKTLIDARRIVAERRTAEPVVGLALSGGGIRSATFCLGVLQALARSAKDAPATAITLRDVDLISTVSGGGYIGAFLGAMFSRPNATTASVERELQNDAAPATQWLRDNGRYLAPNGTGDSWLAASTVLRNWVAVTVVISTLALTLLVAAQLIRALEQFLPGVSDYFTRWSPLLLVPAGLLLVTLIPLGWAYWLGPRDEPSAEYWVWRATELFTIVVTALMLIQLGIPAMVKNAAADSLLRTMEAGLGPYRWLFRGFAATGALTIVFGLSLTSLTDGNAEAVTRIRRYRNYASRGLAGWLMAAAACLCVALIDTIGQAGYTAFQSGQIGRGSLAGLGSAIGAFLVAVQKITTLLDKKKKNKGIGIPLGLFAAIAGIVVTAAMLIGVSAVSHGLARNWHCDPSSDGEEKPAVSLSTPDNRIVVGLSYIQNGCVPGPVIFPVCVVWTIALAGLTWLLGRSLPFVNLSSLTQFYSARLSRTYIGASNPERKKRANASLVQEVSGDDLSLADYQPHRSGGPLHIMNVTLNETVEGRSQIEDRDRKGLAMAIGPVGLSIGVKHHARWKAADEPAQCDEKRRGIVPIRAQSTSGASAEAGGEYHIWSNEKDRPLCPQSLSLSQWTAISGAAVATGMGAGTNVGLSLLLGIGNIRLGHWWDSDVDLASQQGADAKPSVKLQHWFARHFPVQSALTQELFAQFHGSHQKYWFLSDGGHFENTGCYELLRRRVPLIILCDDGADPDYGFEDLANLVRKARLDFGADVRFYAAPADDKDFGTFDDLMAAAPASEPPTKSRRRDAKIDLAIPLARRHLLLGVVRYPDGGQIQPGQRQEGDPAYSVLLVIKPTLTGDEPLDVLQYAAAHPTFPQQATSDQFFDEAQWESYRRLGEHIGSKVAVVPARDLWNRVTDDRNLV
jgi:hypothetical protein